MKNAALYFHYPCFDGVVSSVLTWEFLENQRNWRIDQFCPVDYDVRDTWLEKDLHRPCAIVDFPYHPNANFWADHHQTSLLTKNAALSFQTRRDKAALLFDPDAPSCAWLLYRHLRRFLQHRPHFEEMVEWATKIDSANYASLQEALEGDAPAMRISRALSKKDAPEYLQWLLQALREHDLSYVARSDEVRRRERPAPLHTKKDLEQFNPVFHEEPGEIAVLELTVKDDQYEISRYVPYIYDPNARYSIAIVRTPERITVRAMRNPWRNFRSIALGRAFAKEGGGGHQRIGTAHFALHENDRVKSVVKSLLSQMSRPAR
jgi:hypothetical protein